MSTTLKLPYKRYVCQVSTGEPRLKSSYLDLMQQNLNSLKNYVLREAPPSPVSLTGHDFTASTQFSDSYDAFKLTGNYDATKMTEVAYAGFAAYRFTIPAAAISGGANITSVKVPVYRDRYEKSGVRLRVWNSDAQVLTSTNAPWSSMRSTGQFAKVSQLAQTGVAYLTQGSPAGGVVEFTLSSTPANKTYFWVVVMLEDYTDTWEMYNAKEQRLYAIEGSAMISGADVEFTFDADVTADEDVYTHSMDLLEGNQNNNGGEDLRNSFAFVVPNDATNYMRKITVVRSDPYSLDERANNRSQMASLLYSRFRVGDGVIAETPVLALEGTEKCLRFVSARLKEDTPQASDNPLSVFQSLDLEVYPRAIPFVAPANWDARAMHVYIRFGLSGTVGSCCSINVWLVRGRYIPAITEELARNILLYNGGEASGFERIISVGPGSSYSTDETVKLETPLERGSVSTILIFPMVTRPDDLHSADEWAIGTDGNGACTITLRG